jgi:hypothetical protein
MNGERRPAPRSGVAPPAAPIAPGIDLVESRRLVERAIDVVVDLHPGDRPRVAAGESVAPATPIADPIHNPRLIEVAGDASARPGDRWAAHRPSRRTRRRFRHPEGELLFEADGRWRVAAGELAQPIESPVSGIGREVRPGIGITIRTAGAALRGTLALGDPTRGRLQIAAGRDGELLPRSLDVGSAGTVLVVGARIDAEALTRARAMGIRGIVVATLPGKDRRDYLASEARQRAALHRLAPFGVLVLHGSQRRAIAHSAMDLLERLAGREVGIVGSPPALLFDPDGVPFTTEAADAVHVRSGPHAGRRGRWAGSAGLRRFAGSTHLEAGFVQFDDDQPIALPLGDLERLV